MAIFRKIHVHFWSDVFIQSLTPEQKFFFLYLLTNERTKQCGIYEITTRQISYDTGYNVETVNKLIDFFTAAKKILFSRETNEVAIKNWDKYNGSRSPDVKSLVNKEVKSIKNRGLLDWIQSVDTVLPVPKSSLREEPEREPEREPEEEVGSEVVKNIANEVWRDQIWKEQVCMGLSISMDDLKKWLAQFNSSVSGDNIVGFNKTKYKKMSRGWITTQQAKGVKLDQGLPKKSDAPPLTKMNNGI
jgi:hypothetical protein